ncbi:MAG: GAF domain-containing protein [Elusimicrobiota bacterium]
MSSERYSGPALDRPDLEEFLSALDGFLIQPFSFQDSSYSRFLDIFCRTIGASEGHFLKKNESGHLVSVVSYGMKDGFDSKFNTLCSSHLKDQTPYLTALDSHKVEALVELIEKENCPSWLWKFLDKEGFKSLLVVPLVGQNQTSGVFCAYYRDVCLFDRSTVERLAALGKMMGSASERNLNAEIRQPDALKEKVTDDLLRIFIHNFPRKIDLFALTSHLVKELWKPEGFVFGKLNMMTSPPVFTVLDAVNVPTETVSRRFELPEFIVKKVIEKKWRPEIRLFSHTEVGTLKSFIQSEEISILTSILVWRDMPQAFLVLWKNAAQSFEERDLGICERISSLMALAINVES